MGVNTRAIMAQIISDKPAVFSQQRASFQHPAYKVNPFQKRYQNTFQNQKDFGRNIAKRFLDNYIFSVLAVAPTQSGKTGSMLAFLYECMNDPLLRVNKNNIFICTGHSSCEWLQQTRERFPSWMRDQIFHRNHFKTLSQRLEKLNNVILIVDECHIASKQGQTVSSLLNDIAPDTQSVYKRNIKILQVSATPELLHERFSQLWGKAHDILFMEVPDNYLSVDKLSSQNRILPAEDICGYDPRSDSINPVVYEAIRKIIPFIQSMNHSYHIIRTPRAHKHHVVIQNFKKVFASYNCSYISSNDMDNPRFDSLLSTPPLHHTFIFIKDKLRCAKTIHHQFIGVLYERWVSKPNPSSISQGLLGRMTGFHSNNNAIVFTFI